MMVATNRIEYSKILFATNMKKAFIQKNALKVIMPQVSLLYSVPYKGQPLTPNI